MVVGLNGLSVPDAKLMIRPQATFGAHMYCGSQVSVGDILWGRAGKGPD
jgi:hypothetical protein